MTVKELIHKLSTKDPSMRVVVQGYECGFDECDEIRFVYMTPNSKKEGKQWEGEFEESHHSNKEAETALCFIRKSY